MAWTVVRTSACPVMKIIGMSVRSTAMLFCRSRPFMPGRETSSTRQLGTWALGRARNPCADANVSGCQPSRRISSSSDSRTEISSSTMKTTGVSCEREDCPNRWPSMCTTLMGLPPGIPVVAAELISHPLNLPAFTASQLCWTNNDALCEKCCCLTAFRRDVSVEQAELCPQPQIGGF